MRPMPFTTRHASRRPQATDFPAGHGSRLSRPTKATLAGVIALSTYLPTPELVAAEATAANAGLPILAAHGTEDDVVGLTLGTSARDLVQGRGHPVDWREYPMPHSVCIEEIIDIGAWLKARMATIEAGSP